MWARADAGAAEVTIGVTDSGPGISQENQEAIFERFKQVGSNVRTSTKGFGLGLSLLRVMPPP